MQHSLNSLFSALLGPKVYLHKEKPNPKERLIEIMHAGTPESVKETVLKSMADYDGHVRVLICTIAFGMGVDAKGVRNIINFGPSRNLESYIQESGWCRQDGKPEKCVILHFGRMLSTCVRDMKDYVLTQTCWRQQINSYFDRPVTSSSSMKTPSGHNCCDNCGISCNCKEMGCDHGNSMNSLLQNVDHLWEKFERVKMHLFKGDWFLHTRKHGFPIACIGTCKVKTKFLQFLGQVS